MKKGAHVTYTGKNWYLISGNEYIIDKIVDNHVILITDTGYCGVPIEEVSPVNISKYLDRTKFLDSIFIEIERLAKCDLRVGQIMKIAEYQLDTKDIFNIENGKLLDILKEL
jgi:hypothetical protein